MRYYLYWSTGRREEVDANELAEALALAPALIESWEPVPRSLTEFDIAMM
jgi:hypothetical protein